MHFNYTSLKWAIWSILTYILTCEFKNCHRVIRSITMKRNISITCKSDISFAVSKICTEAVCPMKKLISWIPTFAISHHLCLHPKNIPWTPTVLSPQRWRWNQSSYCSPKEMMHIRKEVYCLVILFIRTIVINIYLRTYIVPETVLKYLTCNISSNPHSSSVIICIL